MPQLLLELFSEEIPARMQSQAARDLERMARERLAEAGFLPEAMASFAGPRRLTLVVEGLPAAQADRSEERKGPRVGAPDAAIDGFLRSTGLTRDQLVERDGVWFATIARTGRPTPEIVAEMVDKIVREFPWPKSMKWGTGALRWVRPLQRILCVFDGEIVPFEIDGIAASDITEGHRVMGSRQPFRARHFDAYAEGLKANYVVLDVEERKRRIIAGARTVCFARNLELVEDQGLLDEVAGLAEWPVPILGNMDPSFLDLPPEVIRTSMRTHQRYFAVRDPATGKLAPHFVSVANIEAIDGGAAIANGNARVLSARLSDAKFFWDEDRKVRLEDRLEKLKGVTFHAKLGTMYERVERIEALAREIAPLVGADPEVAAQAARLAKADLTTGLVGEFPELQGVMGGYYARAEGVDEAIADAIRDQYRPQGPGDVVPTGPVSVSAALADKLDTLVQFFAIDEKPTGSRDPFALRRSALGVIRIVLENGLRLPLLRALPTPPITQERSAKYRAFYDSHPERLKKIADSDAKWLAKDDSPDMRERLAKLRLPVELADESAWWIDLQDFIDVKLPILGFFADRLKVMLRDQGKRHDLVDAGLGRMTSTFNHINDGRGDNRLSLDFVGATQVHHMDDDLVRIVARIDALDAFLTTDDGANLLAGYKRATNILKAEEKKGGLPSPAPAARLPNASEQETALIDALGAAEPAVTKALAAEDFGAAMRSLAALRAPVDAFFDKVLVNSDDVAERENRLRLLGQVRDAMGQVADFSLIAG